MKPILAILTILTLLSCSHDDDTIGRPVITVNTPTDNQHFVKGETIHITGKVTDAYPLTEVGVHMTLPNSTNEFFHNHFSANNQQEFIIDASYTIVESITTNFILHIEAEDRSGGKTEKEISLRIN